MEAATHQAVVRGHSFESFALRDFQVVESFVWNEGEEVELIATLRGSHEAEENEFTYMSWSKSRGWILHCRGLVGARDTPFSPRTSLAQLSLRANGPSCGIVDSKHDSVNQPPQSVTFPTADSKLGMSSAPQLDNSLNSARTVFTVPEVMPNRTEFRQPTVLHLHMLDALL